MIFISLLFCIMLIFKSEAFQISRKSSSEFRLNVCRQMESYFSGGTNPNECWYNPDVDAQAHDIIKRYGYAFESYKVTSKDNYISTLFRIPKGKKGGNTNSQPIFLLHGLATSSHIMLDVGKHSLAFTLVDAGYDVWLGNLRGSTYSVGHRNTSYVNPEYWKFSFHEMGLHDMPANLEFIANKTGKSIIFIGHSLAASIFHVFEDYHRELSKKLLKVAVFVAPMVFLSNIQPLRKEFAKLENPLMVFAALLGVNDNDTVTKNVMDIADTVCNTRNVPPILGACKNGFYVAFGLDSPNILPHYIPLMLAHNPSGFSVNTVNHLLQIAHNEGLFQEFDYGVKKNQELYDDVFPREYDISQCATPIIVFYGADDWLSTEKDIDKLFDSIPSDKAKGKHKIAASKWKHMDYFYGRNADKLFYKPLLDKLKKFKDGKPAKPAPTDTDSAKPEPTDVPSKAESTETNIENNAISTTVAPITEETPDNGDNPTTELTKTQLSTVFSEEPTTLSSE